MRSSAKLFGALTIAGLVAIAGSAFTASSTIDSANKFVGAASQSVSGVHISSVAYTTDAATDVTSAVSFHVAEVLTASDTISATITDDGAGTDSATCTHSTPAAGGGTDLSCAFAPGLSNVTKLDIVAS